MAEENNDKAAEDDFEVEVVDELPGSEPGEGREKEAKRRVKARAEDDEEDESEEGDAEEESEEEGEGDDEKESERLRRARNAKRRVQRQNAALEARLAAVTQHLATLDQRTTTVSDELLGQREQQISAEVGALRQAKMAALQGQQWARADQIDEAINQARRQAEAIGYARQQAQQARTSPRQQAQAEQPNNLAQEWAGKHKWFSPNGSDEDSQLIRELSMELDEEGYAPNRPAHFKELEARAKKLLPHRFKDKGAKAPAGRKTQPVTAGGSSGSGSGRTVKVPRAVIDTWRAAGYDVTKREVLKEIATYHLAAQRGE